MSAPFLRPARPTDDPMIAEVIRTVMTSYGAVGPGFSIEDAEVDAMHSAYDHPRARLLVVDDGAGRVIGCGGVAPLAGGDAATCELKKMYFLPEARGRGLGHAMLTQLEAAARDIGFATIYLETLSSMVEARRLYQRLGFVTLDGPMGNTGHKGCGVFMAKPLAAA